MFLFFTLYNHFIADKGNLLITADIIENTNTIHAREKLRRVFTSQLASKNDFGIGSGTKKYCINKKKLTTIESF